MSKKKHIDELFKGSLQNFEASPSPEVWKNIQAQLKKEKEDRKVIPLWWKLGGVAAVLALLLALNFVFKPFGETTPKQIVTEETDTLPVDSGKDSDELLKTDTVEKDAVAAEGENKTIESTEPKETADKTENEKALREQITNQSQKNQKAIVVEKTEKQKDPKNREDLIKKDFSVGQVKDKETVGIAEAEKTDPSQVISDKNKISPKDLKKGDAAPIDKTTEGIAKNVVKEAVKISDKKEAIATKTEEGLQKTNKKDDPLLRKDPTIKDELNVVKEAIAVEKGKENPVEKTNKDVVEENKKSIFDAIEEEKEVALTKVEDKDIRNWEVTPNIGPVFYNSLSGGSSIDPSFADNTQSGDVNVSYGVQVSYAINDRLSLRSGISNVDLGYRTGGVELATGPVAVALNTVDYGGRSVVLSAFDQGTLNNLPPPSDEGNPFAGLRPKSTSGNAEIIQNLSYYEIPMELKYAVINKRFGVNMIGGFSTLFLGNNEIAVQDGSFRDVLGEANNLNSVSFSTNVGLGFDYKISKRLKFNVEPMFKYQLNPYTDSSVDFRPYYFGIYSGLSFKF